MYVIQDTKSGKYVARPGSERSFTKSILEARKFDSKETANKERCKYGERVVSLYDLLGR